MNEKLVSILIPVKNEALGIPYLFNKLIPILNSMPYPFEIIVINDGSTDESVKTLLEIKKDLPQLVIVDLSRNFGKEAALFAGFSYCTGDCAISIDADLQDPPELILEMVKYWEKGYEVVTAARKSRICDTVLKRITAKLFYNFINKVGEIHFTPNAGDFRLLDRIAINAFLQLSERVRFNKGLLTWIGFRQKVIYHERMIRAAGKTNWNYWKLFKFSIDGITSFSKTPLELWFYLGVTLSCMGIIYAIYYFIRTIIFGIDVHGYPSLLMFILFFSGLQVTGIGILGKYIGRIFIESKQRPVFLVRKIYPNTLSSTIETEENS